MTSNTSLPRKFENTILPLKESDASMSTTVNNLNFYAYVSSDKQVRDASIAATEMFDQFIIQVNMRKDLYQAVKDYKEQA